MSHPTFDPTGCPLFALAAQLYRASAAKYEATRGSRGDASKRKGQWKKPVEEPVEVGADSAPLLNPGWGRDRGGGGGGGGIRPQWRAIGPAPPLRGWAPACNGSLWPGSGGWAGPPGPRCTLGTERTGERGKGRGGLMTLENGPLGLAGGPKSFQVLKA